MPDTSPHRDRSRRPLPIILAATTCLVAIAGCGSSNKTGPASTSAQSGQSIGIKYSECMRSHGVPNFPDPNGSGGRFSIRIGPGTGINPGSPSFRAAQTACGKLIPGGPFTGAGGAASPAVKAQMLAISKCMRAHGVSQFPDPTTHAPSSPVGYAAVLNRDGVVLALPSSIDMNSPVFQQAQRTCGFGAPIGGAPIRPKP